MIGGVFIILFIKSEI